MAKKQSRIIRKAELCSRVGYSDVHVWRLERDGKFPKRVQLGPRSVGWIESEVDDWLQRRIDARSA